MAEAIAVKVGKLEARMEGVESAVLNFRSLDRNVSAFMTEFRVHTAAEEKFHNVRDQEIKDAALLAAQHIKNELDARHKKADLSDKRFKRWMAAAMLFVAVFMAFIANREYERKISTTNIPAPIADTTQTTPPAKAGAHHP
jgi:cell division protein FtsL